MGIGLLTFPAAEELDLVGPWEMLATWTRNLKGTGPSLLIAQSKDPVLCANGMSVNPDVDLERRPPPDCNAEASAGIDMTLAFIASVAGDEIAGKLQFDAEYSPSSVEYDDMRGHDKTPAHILAASRS
jgi:transcriptional regulator GlxA family with amidase domain